MKYSLFLAAVLGFSSLSAANDIDNLDRVVSTQEAPVAEIPRPAYNEDVLKEDYDLRVSVLGQGVSPMNTSSPAQAFALAKRAAIADAYRLIAEKVAGVRVDGQDTVKNMMIKRSTIRTAVNAMVKNANIVETTFKDGLCEVEMEVILSHSKFVQ